MREIPDDPTAGDNMWFTWKLAVADAVRRARQTGRRQQVRTADIRGKAWLVQEVR